jgi:hypothetical protein
VQIHALAAGAQNWLTFRYAARRIAARQRRF